ncbi:MAG: RNA 3'-phosphate cyclase [candidate division NC10 bacterium]|nr:RNA 3'-phosphate cyclase [candidate division NC10 bacterium]
MGEPVLTIDGSQGEGGGQVLRTALALSAIRGVPVEIHSIRARRKNPGLQPQHLTAVTALAAVSVARVEGAHLGSNRVRFVPGPIQPGEYRFDVGTAGSTALVLQALLVPLALAGGPSRITLTGGTHVPWSPPADYMQEVWLPALADLGLCARLDVGRWGFYPKGGGRIVVEVEGGADLRPIALLHRSGGLRLRGVSAVANLPRGIAERQRDRALRRLAAEGRDAEVAVTEAESPGTGSFLMLVAEVAGLRAGFSALGERGKPAEQVADEAVNALLEFLKGEAGCDPHLADQLVLPMALAPGTSRLTTSRVTRHLPTTAQVVQQILGCPMQIGGEEGSPGAVTVEGVGSRAASREPRAERPEPGALPAATNGAQAGERRAATSEIRNPKSEIVPSPLIRKARAEDVPAIQKLVAHFAVRGDLLPRTLNELYQHLRDFFVCQVDGEVVGICALSVYWEDLAEVRSLAVQEAHGGKGLGATLVNACLVEAASLGVRRVFALTYRPGFFEKLGFRSIDKRELPQKIWKDCIKCAKFACCDETALIRET